MGEALENHLAPRIDFLEFKFIESRSGRVDNSFVHIKNLHGIFARNSGNPMYNRILVSGSCSNSEFQYVLSEGSAFSDSIKVEISPLGADDGLLSYLSESGFEPGESQPIFIYSKPPGKFSSSVETRIVENQQDLVRFKEVYVTAWPPPGGFRGDIREAIDKWYSAAGTKFFLALNRDRPIAAAILYTMDKTSYLAYAATLPEFRGLGAQKLLIETRTRFAFDSGSDLVFAKADDNPTSQKNMEKMGFEGSYFRTHWLRKG